MGSQTTQDKRNKWLRNGSSPIFDYRYPNGNRPVPELILASNFNTGNIYPLQLKGTDSVLIVDDAVIGDKVLRFNIASGLLPANDPITGKPRNGNPFDLPIASLTNGASRTWPKIVVKFTLKFDDANNRDSGGSSSQPKLAYFSATLNQANGQSITSTQCSMYPVLSEGSGLYTMSRNNNYADPCSMWPVPTIFTTASANRGFAYNNQPNTFKLILDNVNNYYQMYINGIKALPRIGDPYQDGNYPYLAQYNIFDHFSFFHGSANEWANSTNRTGIAGGGVIYGIQVWKNDPDL